MDAREVAVFAARTAAEKKAEDIVIYDLRGISDVTDYFMIATAQSKLQSRAIVGDIDKELKKREVTKLGQEGTSGGQWVLIDYADVIVHVFSPELREYYNLEALWGDAPKLDWESDVPGKEGLEGNEDARSAS